jgi:hypothetical protein
MQSSRAGAAKLCIIIADLFGGVCSYLVYIYTNNFLFFRRTYFSIGLPLSPKKLSILLYSVYYSWIEAGISAGGARNRSDTQMMLRR